MGETNFTFGHILIFSSSLILDALVCYLCCICVFVCLENSAVFWDHWSPHTLALETGGTHSYYDVTYDVTKNSGNKNICSDICK